MSRAHRAVRALAAASTVVALAACAGPDGDPAEEPTTGADAGSVTIGLTYTPDVQFAPFYVAEEKGYYDEAGVDVTLRHHGASESLFGALEAGEEDLVVAGGDEMLQARSAGVPVVGVATLYEDYPVVLVVPADSPISAPADLAGHSVGIPGPFGETWFGLLALLAEAGLDENDVDVQHIGFTQQAALSAGHVDAVVGFANNDVVQFEQAGTDVRAIPVTSGPVPLVGVGIGAHERLLTDSADATAAVLEATLRGLRDVVASPEEAVGIAAQHVPGLTNDDARAGALATLEATAELYGEATGRADLDQWQEMARFMTEHGLLETEVDVSTAVTNDLLPAD